MASFNDRFFLASALTTQLDTTTSLPTVTETAAVGDQSDNGVVKSNVVSATVPERVPTGAVDLFGRFLDSGAVDLGVNQLRLIAYIIDANHFVITDARDPFVFGGYMLAQPASPVISGTYAFTEAGPMASPSLQAQVAGGIFTCGSGGVLDVTPLSGTPTANQASNVGLSGSYTVNSNGRFPLTLNIATLTPQTIKTACYVVDSNSCLLLSLDATTPGVGILRLQNLGL
jgi:hypothetical protein